MANVLEFEQALQQGGPAPLQPPPGQVQAIDGLALIQNAMEEWNSLREEWAENRSTETFQDMVIGGMAMLGTALKSVMTALQRQQAMQQVRGCRKCMPDALENAEKGHLPPARMLLDKLLLLDREKKWGSQWEFISSILMPTLTILQHFSLYPHCCCCC
jgi:hypothetical protein